MKKTILLTAVVFIIFQSLAVCASGDIEDNSVFNDIYDNNTTFVSDIEYWQSKGVIEGDGFGRFEPLERVTRAELVKMAVLAAEKTEISGGAEPEFSDVSEDNWFYPYVKIAYQNKIIKGNENGSFEPDKYVDFMDIGTICYRAFQKPSMVSFFGDTPRRCDAVHVLSMFESSENTLIQVDGAIEKSFPEFGLYKTVSEALRAAPEADSEENRVYIYISPGTYRERIWIDKPFLTFEKNPEYRDLPNEVLLTFYYGASRNYKSYDNLSPEMEYPADCSPDEEFAKLVKEYESKKSLLNGKPYVKSDGYISGVGTQNSASVTITENAHDFIAQNITFENSYNIYKSDEEQEDIYEPVSETDVLLKENLDTKKRNEAWYQSAKARKADVTVSESKDAQTQAVAVRCSADRSFFNNCRFIGRQDTLYIKDKARCYFLLSYIEGTVDFIFGDANAVFNHCNIQSRAYPNGGYITAGSHSEQQTRGFLFYCCRLNGDDELSQLENSGKVKLGRPWKQGAISVFYKCYMGDHIAVGEDRFADMGGSKKENARFMEMSSRDLDGNYLEGVYSSYEYTEDCRYKYLNDKKYVSSGFDKKNNAAMEPDNWNPGKGIILEMFDDGEIVDGVPVWYDNNNEYFIPEL